jgi:hypothetical protein
MSFNFAVQIKYSTIISFAYSKYFMPMLYYSTMTKQMPWCRLVKTLPCIAVFMSSLTIVVIALDRYLVICRPAHRQVSRDSVGYDSAGLLTISRKDRTCESKIGQNKHRSNEKNVEERMVLTKNTRTGQN